MSPWTIYSIAPIFLPILSSSDLKSESIPQFKPLPLSGKLVEHRQPSFLLALLIGQPYLASVTKAIQNILSLPVLSFSMSFCNPPPGQDFILW